MANSPAVDPPEADGNGVLLYDLDVGRGRMLRVVSDPCHKRHVYCCGNSLWTACIEFIAVLAGSSAFKACSYCWALRCCRDASACTFKQLESLGRTARLMGRQAARA